METNPAYMGWGTHEFDDAPVFLVNLPKPPETYDHEFYIDTDNGVEKLHHRIIDTDVEDTAFTHAFPADEGESVLALLIKHESYWLGFTNVDDADGNNAGAQSLNELQETPQTPDDGLFIQQHIPTPVRNTLVTIGKELYIND